MIYFDYYSHGKPLLIDIVQVILDQDEESKIHPISKFIYEKLNGKIKKYEVIK